MPRESPADGREPGLILPVETKVRELHAKFYLACIAAEQGFRVLIGPARVVRDRICWLPRGSFFLDKSLAPSRALWFQNYRNLGLVPVAWCEEGLIFCKDEEYLSRKVNREALSHVDMFFAWGPYQAELIRKHCPESAERLVETGNPRIDLLSPELRGVFRAESERLKSAYPGLLLVNTNFSLCNHKNGPDAYLNDQKANGKIQSEEDERFVIGWAEHKRKLFDAFVEMIPEISSAFPDAAIVIRPHPSESFDTWREIVRELPNVSVVHEGNIIPWLLAAEAVIHNGCTTGLEAALLDRKVIAYQPVTSREYDLDLPNRISLKAGNVVEVIRLVSSGTDAGGETHPRDREKTLNEYLSNCRGGSAKAIIDLLLDQEARRPRGGLVPALIQNLRRLYWKVRFLPRLSAKYDAHVLQKFASLEVDELQRMLEEFRSETGQFASVRVKPHMGQIFSVTSETRGA